MSAPAPRPTALLFSPPLAHYTSLLPSNPNRSILLFSLLASFGLLKSRPEDGYVVVDGGRAGRREMEGYHEKEYVERLLSPVGEDTDTPEEREEGEEEFGLSDDCPPFPLLPQYASHLLGASLSCASFLLSHPTPPSRPAPIAINWTGGRHHAQRARASGFCYVQDCVLVIQRLRTSTNPRPRVLYLDLDLHFSDAVSAAFLSSPAVLTLSIHHSSPGFFPPSPLSGLTPLNTPHPTTISVPLLPGASAATYARLWPSLEHVKEAFDPTYVVLQCGLDALAGDPCRTFNLPLASAIPGSMGWMVERVRDWGVGTVVLGGGGYNTPNAARGWTYLTSILAGRPLDVQAEIPEHKYWGQYGPSFTLDVPAGNMRDENAEEYLREVRDRLDGLAGRIGASRTGA